MTNTPKHSEREQRLIKQANAITSAPMSGASRLRFDASCYLNFLFQYGAQWVYIDKGGSPKSICLNGDDDKNNRIPRPESNHFAKLADLIMAFISKVEPNAKVFPSSDKPDSVLSADVAQRVLQSIDAQIGLEYSRDKKSRLLVLTGNAFTHVGVDAPEQFRDEKAEALVLYLKSLGTSPDEIKQLVGQWAASQPKPAGKFFLDVYSPLQVFVDDMSVERIEEQDMVMLVHAKPRRYVEEHLGVHGPVGGQGGDLLSMQYHESIPYISSLSSDDEGWKGTSFWQGAGGIGRGSGSDTVYVKQCWKRPSKDYPYGASFILVGDRIADKPNDLPTDSAGMPFIPITHEKFDAVPGAFFGRSRMDRVRQTQRDILKFEAMLLMEGARSSKAVVLMPAGTKFIGLDGKSLHTAEHGSTVAYSQLGENTREPKWMEAPGLTASTVNYVTALVQKMSDLLGVTEMLRGNQDYSGVSDLLAARLIQQGMTNFGPAMRTIAEAYKKQAEYKLDLFRQNPDATISSRVLLGEGAASVKTFGSADIAGAVDIVVDVDSVTPRSEVIKAAQFESASRLGLIDPKNPVERYRALKSLGRTDLAGPISNQYKSAINENARILAGDSVDVMTFVDDPDVHIPVHQDMASDPATPPNVAAAVEQHIQDHILAQAHVAQTIQLAKVRADAVVAQEAAALAPVPQDGGLPPAPPDDGGGFEEEVPAPQEEVALDDFNQSQGGF